MNSLIIKRFLNDTPTFFKKVQVVAGSVSATGTSLVLIHGIPENLAHIGSQMIVGGLVAATLCQLVTKTPPEKL